MSEPRDDFERRFAQRYDSYLEDGVRKMDVRRMRASAREVPSEPSRWWRAALVGAATIGAAAVITLVTIQLLPPAPPAGTASSSPRASVAPSATGEPSATAQPSAAPTAHTSTDWPTADVVENTVPVQLDLAQTAFWTLESSTTDGDWTLRIGTLDGRITREVALTPKVGPLVLGPPRPVGPANGNVLYVADDGLTASLHVVNAATGDDRELTSTDAFIPRLAIDPAGGLAFYLALDRRTGAFQNVFEIAIDGGQPTVLISHRDIQPVPTNATLAAIPAVSTQLVVSSDGQWLVYSGSWCQDIGCDLYAVHLTAGGELLHTQSLQVDETILGVFGGLAIGTHDCGSNCIGFVIDLGTGERWPLSGADYFAWSQVIQGPHGPVALGQSSSDGTWDIEALDLTDRTRSTTFSADYDGPPVWLAEPRIFLQFGRDYSIVRLAAPMARAELPAGWFLIYRTADAAPALHREYSAATLGGTSETPLSIMTVPGG